MPFHKMVHRLVPRAPVGSHARAIPPLGVEFSVTKHHDFRKSIQKGLKDSKEASKPDNEAYGRELHQSLKNGGKVERGNFEERVVEQRCGVLGACKPDENA